MAIYKGDRGFELGMTENKSSKLPERGSYSGCADRCADHSARLHPHILGLILLSATIVQTQTSMCFSH